MMTGIIIYILYIYNSFIIILHVVSFHNVVSFHGPKKLLINNILLLYYRDCPFKRDWIRNILKTAEVHVVTIIIIIL